MTIAYYLNHGWFPIGRYLTEVNGSPKKHWVVFIGHSYEGVVPTSLPSDIEVVNNGELCSFFDSTGCCNDKSLVKSYGTIDIGIMSAVNKPFPNGPYDTQFTIHDPLTFTTTPHNGDPNILFRNNYHRAELGEITQLVIYFP